MGTDIDAATETFTEYPEEVQRGFAAVLSGHFHGIAYQDDALSNVQTRMVSMALASMLKIVAEAPPDSEEGRMWQEVLAESYAEDN